MKYSLGISNFLEETSSISHSIVFFYFFALVTEEGLFMSPSILWNSAFKWVYLSFSRLLFASLLYCAYLFIKYSLGIFNFLKRSLVFPILLFSSVSLHCSPLEGFLTLLDILWNSAFRLVYISFYPY